MNAALTIPVHITHLDTGVLVEIARDSRKGASFILPLPADGGGIGATLTGPTPRLTAKIGVPVEALADA